MEGARVWKSAGEGRNWAAHVVLTGRGKHAGLPTWQERVQVAAQAASCSWDCSLCLMWLPECGQCHKWPPGAQKLDSSGIPCTGVHSSHEHVCKDIESECLRHMG